MDLNKDLNVLAKIIHENAVEHGWWEDHREFPEVIALCHAELSEALEEYRNHKPDVYYNDTGLKTLKPEGTVIELLDCVIRIFDYLGYLGIDIEKYMLEKMKYNEERPYKHGNKRC